MTYDEFTEESKLRVANRNDALNLIDEALHEIKVEGEASPFNQAVLEALRDAIKREVI